MRIYIFIISVLLCSAFAVRYSVIRPIVNYKCKDKTRKRMRQGQTFKEWFLYTRFRKYIPPALIVWDLVNFMFSIVSAIICLVWLLVYGDSKILKIYSLISLFISVSPVWVGSVAYGRNEQKVFDVVDRNKRYYKKKKHPLQKKR